MVERVKVKNYMVNARLSGAEGVASIAFRVGANSDREAFTQWQAWNSRSGYRYEWMPEASRYSEANVDRVLESQIIGD
jgi:hypothetical protein